MTVVANRTTEFFCRHIQLLARVHFYSDQLSNTPFQATHQKEYALHLYPEYDNSRYGGRRQVGQKKSESCDTAVINCTSPLVSSLSNKVSALHPVVYKSTLQHQHQASAPLYSNTTLHQSYTTSYLLSTLHPHQRNMRSTSFQQPLSSVYTAQSTLYTTMSTTTALTATSCLHVFNIGPFYFYIDHFQFKNHYTANKKVS